MKDVVIIGAGPVGLYASYYCGFHKLDGICFESLASPGGQMNHLYKEKFVYDIPGFKKITAGDFIAALVEQYSQFEDAVPMLFNRGVKDIKSNKNGHFIVETNEGGYETRAALITSGGGEFKHRKLSVDNADNFANIHYTARLEDYRGRRVAVLGGGDSAVDFALAIESIADEAIIVHRSNEFRAHAHSVELLRNSTVKVLTPYSVVGLEGAGDKAQALVLQNAKSGEEISWPCDYVLVNYGLIPSGGKFEEWGLDTDKGRIIVNHDYSTNMRGIFAAGNCTTYEGKIKTIAVGLGEVPVAVTAIKRYLNPGKNIATVYSSSK